MDFSSITPNRIIPTVSSYAKEHLLYVQEIGTLTSRSPHVSTRNNIYSFLFLVVIKGSGRFSYLGETVTLKAGDCVFIDCHQPYSHESSANDPWTLNWVHFYGKELLSIYKRYLDNGCSHIFHPDNTGDFLEILRLLYGICASPDASYEIVSNKYLTDLITSAFVLNKNASVKNASMSHKLRDIREYITVHYSEHISLEGLSNLFYISKFHLAREYKKAYGSTLIADLSAIRISHAKYMLRFTESSIEEISTACGFSDSGYFIKVFSKSEGMTPLVYRKKW